MNSYWPQSEPADYFTSYHSVESDHEDYDDEGADSWIGNNNSVSYGTLQPTNMKSNNSDGWVSLEKLQIFWKNDNQFYNSGSNKGSRTRFSSGSFHDTSNDIEMER